MNPECNYLAYLRNQCYGLRKFNYVFDLKMSAFGRLKQGFAGAAAATVLLAAPACAQEDIRTTAQASPASYSTEAPANDGAEQEAWMDAQDYSLENVALTFVIYGRTSRYSGEDIERNMTAILQEAGLQEGEYHFVRARPDQIGVRAIAAVDGAMTHDNIMGLREIVEHIPRAVSLFQEHAPIMRERLEEERRSRPITSAALDLNGTN
jgi:hypothetical protein